MKKTIQIGEHLKLISIIFETKNDEKQKVIVYVMKIRRIFTKNAYDRLLKKIKRMDIMIAGGIRQNNN